MSDNIKLWFVDRYGSTRGFVRTVWHRMLNYVGVYRKYRQVDWKKVDRVVFVCRGNICRSAYAEVVASEQGLNSASCGVNTVDGAPANEKAAEAALRNGRDLRVHLTKKSTSLKIGSEDLFVVMEPWHATQLVGQLGPDIKCTLLGLWHFPATPHVEDPHGSTLTYFDKCFKLIEISVNRIASEIEEARKY